MLEPSSNHPSVKEWLAHVRTLSVEIGPRGSTRPGERQGAEYARAKLEQSGLKPVWEAFKSIRSIFHPQLLSSILVLAAFILFPLGGRLTALLSAALTVLAIVSELQELGSQNNLFRLLVPKGESQNVFAVIPPKGLHKRDLVLVGHGDSQRTPLIYRSPKWVKAFGRFTLIAIAGIIIQALLYSLAAVFGWGWVWWISILSAIPALLLGAICIEADSTPFSAGANDNASGVGMLLTMATHLARDPLENTRIFAVVTGCEEVQHNGMIDFFQRHRGEMKAPQGIIFEMLGCAGPAWTIREGIIVPFSSDPKLVGMAERLSAGHPEWQAYPARINAGNSELSDALHFKVPAISVFGLKPDGEAPFWHQRGDTFDKMDPQVMERTWEFSWALVQEIDRMG
jgi:hypothetical protein